MLTRAGIAAYLLCLFLLPWAWFPPFPWLHVHAQWSDGALAIAVVVWAVDRWRSKDYPRLRGVHAAIGVYLFLSALSLARAPAAPGAWKLLGLASLAVLALLTADYATRPGMMTAADRESTEL